MWQDILNERNRRENQRWQSYHNNLFPSPQPPTQDQAPPEEDNGGFFGGIAKGAGEVGNFFGDMIGGVVKSTKEAVGTVSDIVGSIAGQTDANAKIEAANKAIKELNARREAGTISKEEFESANQKISSTLEQSSKDLSKGGIMKRDAAKSAAATAETFLNVATLGAGGLIKQGAQQVAKKLGANIAERGAQGATEAATGSLVNNAVKKVGQNVAEGGLLGAGYGGLAPVSDQGSNVNPEDIWRGALMGGATGGAIGGAASLLDRNVRAGLRQLPNDIRAGTLKTAAQNSEVQMVPTNALSSLEGAPDKTRVAEYEARIRSGGNIEPIIAMRDSAGNLTVEDGKHRLEAYLNQGVNDVPVQVVTPGDLKAVTQGGYARIPGGGVGDMISNNTNARPGAEIQKQIEDALNRGDETTAQQVISTLPEGDLKQGMQSTIDALNRPAGTRAPIPDSFQASQEALRGAPMRDATTTPLSLPLTAQTAQDALTMRPALPTGDQPLLLPQGELPAQTLPQARKQFGKTGESQDFINKLPSGKKPIELTATPGETANIAMVKTPGGKVRPLASNNAHAYNDEIAAIKDIADRDAGSKFTTTRTPEMNLEEAFASAGGADNPHFRALNRFNTDIRDHTAQYSQYVDDKRAFFERFLKEFNVDGTKAQAMRPYLEAADDATSKIALKSYGKQFGPQAAEGMARLRTWWRNQKDVARNETNAVIEKFAGKDRTIGDLGETYLPRVYKRGGIKGLRDSVLDVAHSGLDKIGGKKGLMNLESPGDYLSKESETTGGVLRGSEGIPLNSELAKPNTQFLSQAQKRTAKSPIGEMEDPITAMYRYFEATGRARFYTPDIAKGRTLQKAIENVNGETGNLRQMYRSFDDQINALANKTNRLDRYFTDSKTGNAVVSAATKIQRNISRSTILGSATSAMAQTGQLPLIVAENGATNFTKGMGDMFKFIGKSKKIAGDPLAQSSLMTSRYREFEDAFKVSKPGRAFNKATDVIAKPFRIIEQASSELAWRSSYNKALEQGLSGKPAVQEADRITAKIIGERSPGARAALYESKALGPVSAYTLEVNQLYQTAKQYFKRDPKKALKLIGAIWLYNQGYQAVTGNKLNADPLQASADAGNILFGDQYLDQNGDPIGLPERLARATGRLGGEALDATPLGNTLAAQLYPQQGFRVPFGGGDRMLSRADIFGNTNLGRYGGGTPISSGLSNPLLLLGVPGMSQFQKSVEGSNAYNEGASTTPGGNTRFTIDPNTENYWRAILFGQYGTSEGQQYLDNKQAQLSGQNTRGLY